MSTCEREATRVTRTGLMSSRPLLPQLRRVPDGVNSGEVKTSHIFAKELLRMFIRRKCAQREAREAESEMLCAASPTSLLLTALVGAGRAAEKLGQVVRLHHGARPNGREEAATVNDRLWLMNITCLLVPS